MPPFAIVCTTCSSRLKVRDPRLIGQIVTCPSCGAMVEIRPPADSPDSQAQPPSDPPQRRTAAAADSQPRVAIGREGQVDSQAITQDALSPSDLPGVAAGAEPSGPVFAPSDVAPADAADQAADRRHADPQRAADGSPMVPVPGGWQSDRAERARQIGLIAALSIAGIIVAAITFGFFVRRWQQQQQELQRQQVAQQAEPDLSPTAEPSTPAEPSAAPQSEHPSPTAPEADSPSSMAPRAVSPGSAALEADHPSSTVVDAASDPADPAASTQAADTRAADSAVPPAAVPPGASLLDSVASSLLESPAAASDAAEAAAAPSELPAGLRQFTPLIDFGSPLPQEPQAGRLPPPPTLDQVRLEAPADEQEEDAALGPAEPIDAPRWMKMRLALQGQGRPLVQWVRLLSQVSGVPIELDLASLDAAGIDPNLPVDAPQGWTTAGEAIEQIAAGGNLTMTVEPTHVVLAVPDAVITQGVLPALRIDDLLAQDEAEVLRRMLQQISGVEAIGSDEGDPGRLRIEGDRQAVWRVALATEALRSARGLPLRLPRNRTQRWLTLGEATDWPLIGQGNRIAAADQPQAVLQWLAAMAQANDAHLIVAWGDAWQRGLTPQSAAMPWMRPVEAGELIAEVLEPYGLQARDAGGGIWWIGSQASYDRGEVVGVVPAPNAQAAEVLERLAQAIELRQQDGDAPQTQLPAVFDADSQQLIVRLPRYLVRQLPKLFGAGSQP